MSQLNKPGGLLDSEYYTLRRIHQERCVYCGREDVDFEWDHVMPTSLGGWNLAWNLEPSCRRCNAQKSNLLTSGSYWFQSFALDGKRGVDFSKFRQSQLLPFNALLDYKEHFKNETFLKEVFRVQLLYLATVSAGKTLSILSIVFALNHIFLDIYPASPRIDRVLVVTKDEDLREQLTSELKKEPLHHGIFTADIGVKVEAIRSRRDAYRIIEKYRQDRNLIRDKIYVCCQQLLWESGEEELDDIIKSFLSIFRAAFFDESHWSSQQARKIQAYLPFFKFNLTGTPFDEKAKPYDYQIKIAHWGSQEAQKVDGSLKMLPASPEGIIIQPKPKASEFEFAGGLSTQESEIEDHKNNLKTVMSSILEGLFALRADDESCKQVARDIEQMKRGSLSKKEFRSKYLHPERTKKEIDREAVPDLIYPSFMGVMVSSFSELQSVKEQFKVLVPHFPELLNIKEYVSVAHGNNKEPGFEGRERTVSGITLDETHPWMLAHIQSPTPFRYNYDFEIDTFEWKLPNRHSRILIYVDKNREGCNNRYSRVFVLARTLNSKKTLVQSIGRYIRGVRFVDSDGVVHVPPQQLDKPLIISHDAFQNEASLIWTWNYLRDPVDTVEEFPTLEDLISGLKLDEQEQEIAELVDLPNASKLEISEAVGRLQEFETTGDITHITTVDGEVDSRFKQNSNGNWQIDATKWSEFGNEEKTEQIQNLVETVKSSPEEASKSLFGEEVAMEVIDLKMLPVLKHESFDFYNEPFEIVEESMKSLEPVFYEAYLSIPDTNHAKHLLRKQYAKIKGRCHVRRESSKIVTVEQIRQGIVEALKQDFRFVRVRLGADDSEWKIFCAEIIRTTRRVIYAFFGLSSFEVDSEFDIPEYHWKLIKNKARIKGQIRRILVQSSSHLSYLRSIVE